MIYFTEDLVADMKRSEFFPNSQATFTDPDDFIAYLNDELLIKLIPLIVTARQEFFLTHKSIYLRSGVNHYGLPERAVGNSLKDLWYLPNVLTPDVKFPLPKLQKHAVTSYASVRSSPSGFYLEGDEVVLVPTPSGLSGTEGLMFDYLERPNRLVQTATCTKITAISAGPSLVTLTVNTDLTAALGVGGKVDLLCSVSPFRLWNRDVLIQSIAATQIILNLSDVVDESGTIEIQVGDFICPAQTSCTPRIPQEFRPVLAEMGCFRVLKALGATTHLQMCASNIKDMLSNVLHLISNRVEDEIDVVYDRNGFLGGLSNFGYQGVLK